MITVTVSIMSVKIINININTKMFIISKSISVSSVIIVRSVCFRSVLAVVRRPAGLQAAVVAAQKQDNGMLYVY